MSIVNAYIYRKTIGVPTRFVARANFSERLLLVHCFFGFLGLLLKLCYAVLSLRGHIM